MKKRVHVHRLSSTRILPNGPRSIFEANNLQSSVKFHKVLSDLIFSNFIDRRRKGAYFVMDKFPVTHSILQLHLFQQIFLMKQQSSCVLQQNERVHSATMTMTFRMKRMKNEVRAQPASALTLAANSFDGWRGSSLELDDEKKSCIYRSFNYENLS